MVTTASSPEQQNSQEHLSHAIDMNRLSSIELRIATPPAILSKSAGREKCSIFKVPKSFADINKKLYQPQIISIGPFHHNLPHLLMMEEYKYQYLGQLLDRTSLSLSSLFEAVIPLEAEARECYSEEITLDVHDYVEMLVVDGCFVIELFRKAARLVPFEADDPIASMSWIFPALLRDLHLLENQIPFVVLQKLFDLTSMTVNGGEHGDEEVTSLALLCLSFFNHTLQRPCEVIWKYKDLKPKHLLDLLRSSFITPQLDAHDMIKVNPTPTRVILPISKLRKAGIELRPGKMETFLAVKFKAGVIEMPTITFDDFMSSFLANCVVLEQCHKNSSSYFTTYTTLVDCLVNTANDVEYLCDRNIMENYFGTEAEIASFINNVSKDVAFDIDQCYLAKLFDAVNSYYKNSWNVYWAGFKYTYFSSPWSFISALAASVLLVLTVMQTLYTVMPYYKQNN